ncbi:MAG: hypothetical protein RL115_340 [Bacteroidota bacterium]
MKYWIAIGLLFFFHCNSYSQRHRMKAGFIGFPTVSGFGIGTVGYEIMNKAFTKSWQIHINGAGGAIGTDVGTVTRKWLTFERSYYHFTIAKKISWSYSFFSELGNRTKENGDRGRDNSRILDKIKTIELNPGAQLGMQCRVGKSWGIEMQAGPKLIIATGKAYYLDMSQGAAAIHFNERVSEIKPGYSLMGKVYIQF